MIRRHRRATQPVDINVGSRIRARRTHMGLTQEELAASLGISNQQVQKYETGANRVSAARLFELAQLMNVELGYFFEGVGPLESASPVAHAGKNRMAIDLVRNFLAIGSVEKRAALANLVKVLKEHCPGSEEGDVSYGTKS